jgi:hypothetical protein
VGCVQQLRQFQQGGSPAAAVFHRAQQDTLIVGKTDCADAAFVVDTQQVVHFGKRAAGERLALIQRPLASPCMIARNHATAPAIGFRIRECEVKYRIALCRRFAKLAFRGQYEIGRHERRAFTRALFRIAQLAKR